MSEYDELVKRLREQVSGYFMSPWPPETLMDEAADAITRLQERLVAVEAERDDTVDSAEQARTDLRLARDEAEAVNRQLAETAKMARDNAVVALKAQDALAASEAERERSERRGDRGCDSAGWPDVVGTRDR